MCIANPFENTDRNERETEFLYDNLHRCVQETWLDGQTVVRTIAYEWDAAGQLLSVDDADADYEYAYNALGQVTQIMADVGSIVVLTQGFDAVGNRTSLSAEIDEVADFLNGYTFDGLGRNTRIEQSGQLGGNAIAEKRVDLEYFADGQLAALQRFKDLDGGSGNLVAESEFGYDGMGRLVELTHSDGVTVINACAWAYDTNSRITEVESIDGTSAYSYDATGQVIDVDHSYQADEGFSFDENGNRTMAGYIFGDNNQLLSDGTWDYLYDGEGNTVRKTRISEDPADDHRIDYEWDHRNRLMSVLFRNNDNVVTKAFLYFYDYLDRRTAKNIDNDGPGEGAAEEERFIYDGAHVVLILNGAGDVKNRVLQAPGVGQVLADEKTGRGVLWMLTDNQGTVRDIVDQSGAVQNHITYSAFGSITDETDPTDNLVYYAGRPFDRETGNYENRARLYAPGLARFLSEDPIKDGTNWQVYVGNSPANFTDPTGLISYDWSKIGHLLPEWNHLLPQDIFDAKLLRAFGLEEAVVINSNENGWMLTGADHRGKECSLHSLGWDEDWKEWLMEERELGEARGDKHWLNQHKIQAQKKKMMASEKYAHFFERGYAATHSYDQWKRVRQDARAQVAKLIENMPSDQRRGLRMKGLLGPFETAVAGLFFISSLTGNHESEAICVRHAAAAAAGAHMFGVHNQNDWGGELVYRLRLMFEAHGFDNDWAKVGWAEFEAAMAGAQ